MCSEAQNGHPHLFWGRRKPVTSTAFEMPPAPFPAGSHWESCFHQFMTQIYARSHSQSSVRVYSSTLIRFFQGERAAHPERVRRRDIEAFVYQEPLSPRGRGKSKPPSPATSDVRLAVLRSFYDYASSFLLDSSDEDEEIALFNKANPTAGMHFSKRALNYHAIPFEDISRFFAVIPRDTVQGLRDRAIFLFYFWTARRREEIARLRWGDLEYGVIVEEGGGRHMGWLYRFKSKGHGEQEFLAELPQPAKDALDLYLEASGRLKHMRPTSPLFVAAHQGPGCKAADLPTRDKPLSSNTIYALMKQYARKAGLDAEKISIHSWRHTATQQRYAAGQDIRSLQKLLLHESLATTDRYLQGLLATADPGIKLLEQSFRNL